MLMPRNPLQILRLQRAKVLEPARGHAQCGMPTHFRWKESEWPVSEVFGTWQLMDRWWVRPVNPATATYSVHHGEQDRTYYRVCCCSPAGEQVFDCTATRSPTCGCSTWRTATGSPD